MSYDYAPLIRGLVREVVEEELLRRGIHQQAQAPSLDKLFLTAEEVGRLLCLSRRAVYARAIRGAIPGAFHVGRSLRFRCHDLKEWLGALGAVGEGTTCSSKMQHPPKYSPTNRRSPS